REEEGARRRPTDSSQDPGPDPARLGGERGVAGPCRGEPPALTMETEPPQPVVQGRPTVVEISTFMYKVLLRVTPSTPVVHSIIFK
ncbi:hypothetical protein NDU88_007018, partial [Pleurodeles waltl]